MEHHSMFKRLRERLKGSANLDEPLSLISEQSRARCLQLSQVFSSLAVTKADIEDVIRTSSTYEHFRVAIVFMLASRSELENTVVAHWRECIRDVGRKANGRTQLLESPSFRQFSLEAKLEKSTSQSIGDTSALTAAFQRKLLSALGCPITKGPVEVIPTVFAADAVREGIIVSRRLGRVIGVIKNFQIDFVRFPACRDLEPIRSEILAGNLPESQSTEEGARFESAFSKFFKFAGDWRPLDDTVLVSDCISGKSSVHFSCSRPVKLRFNAHPWSGIVEILVNDSLVATVDLFEAHTTVPRSVVVPIDMHGGPVAVEIRVSGESNPLSMGRQCLFLGCSIADETQVPIRYKKRTAVRGAEFDKRFWDMLASVPASGLVLDLGGGNRQISDSRYVNLDYAPYPEPDVIGDALQLPFMDDVFDLVYSTGVFEHLRDPILAAQEIHRVTKPGGRILIGIAFMQPIHSEGQHFFNCTPWGIEVLFKQFKINDVSWEGSLSFLVEWMLRSTHLDRIVGEKEIAPVLDSVKRWDALISYEQLKYIANGVWCDGTKVT
jgi:SAM-dependent methyltransferase